MAKKSIIATVGAAALAAASPGLIAAAAPTPLQWDPIAPSGGARIVAETAPLVRFTMLTRGDFSPPVVEAAVVATFPGLGEEAAAALPDFVRSLARLPLTPAAHRAAQEAAILVLSAADIADSVFYALAAQTLSAHEGTGGPSFRLAQNALTNRSADRGLCERAAAANVREPACDPPQSYQP